MQRCQPLRGMKDWFPESYRSYEGLVDRFRSVVQAYGFSGMQTPIVEQASVYHKTLGETSDVVQKEMYRWTDQGGEDITLRPEFTAGVMRAVLSEGWLHRLPCRWWSHGPLFRRERPQAGRLRQFHQLNAECIGDPSPLADAEMMAMSAHFLRNLGLTGLSLLVHTVGDASSRAAYRERLLAYFLPYRHELSPESQGRLERNPLRLLDSKQPQDQRIVADAPFLRDSLSLEARAHWEEMLGYLSIFGVPYRVEDRLVRGLDYYSHTIFEWVDPGLGAQSTVLAGGRYDGLACLLGHDQPVPAVGMATGMERLLLAAGSSMAVPEPSWALILPIEDSMKEPALRWLQQWREEGLSVQILLDGPLAKRFKKADQRGASWVIVMGPEEWSCGTLRLRHLATGQEHVLAPEAVVERIVAEGGGHA